MKCKTYRSQVSDLIMKSDTVIDKLTDHLYEFTITKEEYTEMVGYIRMFKAAIMSMSDDEFIKYVTGEVIKSEGNRRYNSALGIICEAYNTIIRGGDLNGIRTPITNSSSNLPNLSST